MASVYEDFRTALMAKVSAADVNIGQVRAADQIILNWTDYLRRVVATIGGHDQVRMWWVSREADSPPQAFDMDGRVLRHWNFVVRGVVQVYNDGDSQTAFEILTDQVITSIDSESDLGSAAILKYGVGPSYRRVHEPRQFGNILCHYTEIAVPLDYLELLTLG